MGFYAYFNFIILVNLLDRSREDSKDEHMHLSDAVLESVMVFRLGAGARGNILGGGRGSLLFSRAEPLPPFLFWVKLLCTAQKRRDTLIYCTKRAT